MENLIQTDVKAKNIDTTTINNNKNNNIIQQIESPI